MRPTVWVIALATIGAWACLSAGAADADHLPDPHKTPGAIMESCTLADVKDPGYTLRVRDVPRALAGAVYRDYGLHLGQGVCALDEHNQGCEVDHLISLVLCGSNERENLWIQPYHGLCNAHNKDALEVRLHELVKTGQLDLATAQAEISTNWIAAYRKHIGPLECGG